MNKDILKYRVWSKVQKKYITDLDFFLSPEGQLFVYENGEIKPLDMTLYQVEKCTGLKDKNRKLIFENDIIKREVDVGRRYIKKEDIDVVKWSINGFMLENYFDYFADTDDFEVIGNIHENRELLRRKTND